METANYTVVKTSQEMVNSMKGKFRSIDRMEVRAMSNKDIDISVQEAFEKSELCWCVFLKDEPVIVFGVTNYSLLSLRGSVWLLGTDKMRLLKTSIGKKSKYFVGKMFDHFDYLENWVDKRNKLSIKWLKWIGFNIDPAKSVGHEGRPFHHFWLEKENYV